MSDNDEEFRGYASPACSRHEVEGEGFTGMNRAAVVSQLNELLEGERAGARGLRDTRAAFGDTELGSVVEEVCRDEARYCAMLTRHIQRLGGTPSRETGVFYDKLLQRPDTVARLELLDRGQQAVVRSLERLLGLTLDAELRADLEEMRDRHVHNIRRCAEFLPSDV